MYHYDAFDQRLVEERAAEFRQQVESRLQGTLTEEEFKPLRLMNGLYLQLHAYMLRVAIPYGVLSSEQLVALADIADSYDRGYGHFTTRQNIQFNWLKLTDVPDILDKLARVQMHAIQTSGNCIRNITADPLAGIANDEIDDPRPTAELLRQWSSMHPEFSYLPRKFKLALTGSSNDRAAVHFHDIGLRLIKNDLNMPGYEVLVGGGQGRTPVIGSRLCSFLPRRELLAYVTAIMRVYNLYGRRDNKYKARIKILVRELGIEEFKRQVDAEHRLTYADHDDDIVEKELARIQRSFKQADRESGLGFTETHDVAYPANEQFTHWRKQNVIQHKIPGCVAVIVTLKASNNGAPGDLDSNRMRKLAGIARVYSDNELRVTHEQNIVLPYVKKHELHTLWQQLDALKLADANAGLATDIIACPGMDYCSLATARSIPVAKRISDRFASLARQQDIGPLSINVSGCINACGHHHVGNIGVLGLEKGGEEYYQLTLGGDASASAHIGERTGPGFSSANIIDAVDRVVDHYVNHRREGESFLKAYRRLGAASFKEALYAGH